MQTITASRVCTAVHHAAFSALVPKLLAPHNKYAIIYLRVAGGRECWEGESHCKTAQTHTCTRSSVGFCFTIKNTHLTLAQGHIK